MCSLLSSGLDAACHTVLWHGKWVKKKDANNGSTKTRINQKKTCERDLVTIDIFATPQPHICTQTQTTDTQSQRHTDTQTHRHLSVRVYLCVECVLSVLSACVLAYQWRSREEVGKLQVSSCCSNAPTTHCNTLQHTATHCNTLQHTATHCYTLLHTATHCHTLLHTATRCNTQH